MGFFSSLGSVLPGLLGFGGSVGAAGLSLQGVREQNRANQQMAQQQMSFQERMSGTAYQRTMADMQAAGMNPILAANQGGASTPSGSTAQMQNEFGGIASSAMDMQRSLAELQNMKAQNKNLLSQSRLSDAMRLSAIEEAKVKGATAKNLATQLPGLETERKIDEGAFGRGMRYLQRLNPLSGLMNLVK